MKRILMLAFSAGLMASAQAEGPPLPEGAPSDTLALVGDELITFSQLNTQLNSTAVVGLSTPALGTPERRTAMLTLLDKAISVNLLYLDALKQGGEQDPGFRQQLQSFSDGVLIGLYRKQYMHADTHVSDQEIQDYFAKHFEDKTELTERLRAMVEAKIRKHKLAARKSGLRAHVRDGVTVKIHAQNLQPEDDALRKEGDVIAEYDGRRVTWEETKVHLTTLNNQNLQRRLATLDELIDNQLMAAKARRAGLEKDPSYQKRMTEYTRTRLVNLHRDELIRTMQPTEQELRDYYEKYVDSIAFKEHRKLQMVVLADKAEAETVKARIDKGEITMFQAALEHSIDPRVKQTLGDFGWVEKGSGFPELDKLAFSLAPGELGGPVQSPAGWHLVLVTDQRESRYDNINEDETRTATRRLMVKDQLGQYLTGLRQEGFPVVVFDDNLNRLLQEEMQWIAAKSKEMEANPERARLILEEMRALVE